MRYKGRTALLVLFLAFGLYGLIQIELAAFSTEFAAWPFYRRAAASILRYLAATVVFLSALGLAMLHTSEPLENILSHGSPYSVVEEER